jgi:ketosteroid isomerase-like protein
VGPVSVENVEIVRRLVDAFEREDEDAQLAIVEAEVEIRDWPEGPDPRTYHGHAGMREAWEWWGQVWEWLRVETADFVDAGDLVLTCGRIHGKGKGSTVEVSVDAFNVYTLRDGKVIRMEFFTDRERALEAAGLSGAESEASR